MSRPRFVRIVFLAFVLGMSPVGAVAGGGSNPTYDGVVNFGSQLLQSNDECLSVDGTVTSGDFFDQLKRKDIAGRLEFRKHGRLVTQYPESITTSIRIAGGQCSAAFSHFPSSIFNGDSYSLKFAVEWKDGMQLRPAVLSSVAVHCVGYSSIAIPRRDYTIPSIQCQMTVQSRGVPLGDHLIVSVFTADGSRLTRLSAAP
jgi:hypothetical protein